MNSDTVHFEVNDQFAVLTLNRPQARNPMNSELRDALMKALQRVRDDADIRVGVLTGGGWYLLSRRRSQRTGSGRAGRYRYGFRNC